MSRSRASVESDERNKFLSQLIADRPDELTQRSYSIRPDQYIALKKMAFKVAALQGELLPNASKVLRIILDQWMETIKD